MLPVSAGSALPYVRDAGAAVTSSGAGCTTKALSASPLAPNSGAASGEFRVNGKLSWALCASPAFTCENEKLTLPSAPIASACVLPSSSVVVTSSVDVASVGMPGSDCVTAWPTHAAGPLVTLSVAETATDCPYVTAGIGSATSSV